jgi:hypothetical protein
MAILPVYRRMAILAMYCGMGILPMRMPALKTPHSPATIPLQ